MKLSEMVDAAGPQHTSGVMRCRFEVIGGHVHCRMFGPYSGKAGDLVFRVDEWEHVRKIHPDWQFIEEPPDSSPIPTTNPSSPGSTT